MKKIIVTNNEKVAEAFADKAEINFMQVPAPQVLEEAKAIASNGGKLLADPSRESVKNFFRSIPFIVDGSEPNKDAINVLDSVIKKMNKKPDAFIKKPVLASVHENRDFETILKVLG